MPPAARRAVTGSPFMTRASNPPDPDEGLEQAVDDSSSVTPGTQPRPSAEPVARDRLGDFRLDRRLGAGGMGEVFAATHLQTGQQVALKMLRITGPTRLYRFKREF